MYDIFGEFDTADEINASAEGLFNEGDFENMMAARCAHYTTKREGTVL